jgi:hypothetical protein
MIAMEKKHVLHILSVCVRREMRMRLVVIRGLLAVHYFSTLSHKRHNFRENVIGNKMCVIIFSAIFCVKISHSTKN